MIRIHTRVANVFVLLLSLITIGIQAQQTVSLTGLWNTNHTEYTIQWSNGPPDVSLYYIDNNQLTWLEYGTSGTRILYTGNTDQKYAAIVGRVYVLRTGDNVIHAVLRIPGYGTALLPFIAVPNRYIVILPIGVN